MDTIVSRVSDFVRGSMDAAAAAATAAANLPVKGARQDEVVICADFL